MSVKVGNYEVLMRSTSQLPDLFRVNPNYSSELGRLVETTYKKYPDLCVLDVGANFGDSVAIIKTFANVPVVCVEGDEDCLSLLTHNTQRFSDVLIFSQFLGEKTETILAATEKQGWNATIIPSANGSSKSVGMKSLDDLLESVPGLEKYKLLKIDTEGFDCRIIRGGLNYIRSVKPVLSFEYNRDNMTRIGEKGIETLSALRDIGYDVVCFYDGTGRLVVSTRLSDFDLVKDLHCYADGTNGAIYFYDLIAFHRADEDIASEFRESERRRVGVRA